MRESAREIRLTKEQLETSRVIARGQGIRAMRRLIRTYGGIRSGWVKKSTRAFHRDGQAWEYHWYEHHGIGRVEIKIVRVMSL